MGIPVKYAPSVLTNKDRKKQIKALKRSRRDYKKGIYTSRPKIKSYPKKVSKHIIKARKIYGIHKIKPSKKLARKTGCDKKGLTKIVKKGIGAYYSSGSRPSQTGHSWGYARLASAITGGKSSGVDYHILKDYCSKKSKALRLAKKFIRKHGKGTRRVKKIKLKGGRTIKKKITKTKSKSYRIVKAKSMIKKPKTGSYLEKQDEQIYYTNNKPIKNKKGNIVFKGYPIFRPNLTPFEVIKMGSFGGTYFRPIESFVTKKKYRDHHLNFPKSWWEEIPDEKLTNLKYNKKINKYGVRCGTSLEFWELKGWISEYDPYGWFHWYCNFYNGRRIKPYQDKNGELIDEDQRQIDRWDGVAGKKGRFKNRLINMIKAKGAKYNDFKISPVIRQVLQHWAVELKSRDLN